MGRRVKLSMITNIIFEIFVYLGSVQVTLWWLISSIQTWIYSALLLLECAYFFSSGYYFFLPNGIPGKLGIPGIPGIPPSPPELKKKKNQSKLEIFNNFLINFEAYKRFSNSLKMYEIEILKDWLFYFTHQHHRQSHHSY